MAHFHFRATTARRSSAEAEAEEGGRDSQRGRGSRGGGIKGRRTRSRVRAFLGLCFSSSSNSNRNRNSSKNNNNNGSGSSSDDDENEKLPNARATTTAAATAAATATARFRPLRYRSTTTTTTTTTRLRPPPPPPPAATQQQQQQQQQQPQPQQQQLFEPHPGLQLLQPPAVPASAPAIADAQDSTPQYLPPIRQTTPISLSGTTIQAKPPLRKPWKHLPRPTLRKHHTYSPTHHHNHSHSHTRHPHRSSLKSKLPLLSFPPEIILLIASHLDTDDQHALLLSSRALAALVTPLFQYSAMAAQGFNPALDFPPLHWAAWKGHTPLVRQLLDQGHDANARTLVHGTTPLHHAARWGHEGVVRVLLQQGAADVNAQDTFDGKTPLHLARLEGRVEVCNVLVAAGASVAVRDDAGRTPMAYMGGNSCEDYHWRPRGGGDGRGRAPAGERVFGREGGAGY